MLVYVRGDSLHFSRQIDSVKGLLDLNRTPLTFNYLLLVCYCFSTLPLK